MIAHVSGVPLEELLATATAGAGAGLAVARVWVVVHLRRHRPADG